MRCDFFPHYSEDDLLNRKYSFMARLQVIPPDTTEAREFLYHADMIQRDIAEEDKQRRMKNAMDAARGSKVKRG